MTLIVTPSMAKLADAMRAHANTGIWNGTRHSANMPYFQNAQRDHVKTGTMLLLTREAGYHTSGFFKNPDYERCWHLSISFYDPEQLESRPFDDHLAALWCHLIFGEHTRYIWRESGKAQHGGDLYHYRVFYNAAWQPIIPRGEVYSRDFIEKGWKSYSDLKYERQQEGK